MAVTFTQVRDALAPVEDPELHIGLLELGLVYEVAIAEGKVNVKMSLTSPACPYGPMLMTSVHGALAKLEGVKDVNVDLTFKPVWDPRKFASDEAMDKLGIF